MRSLLALSLSLALPWLGGCTASTSPARGASSAPAPEEWKSPLYRDHPLVGRIWDARTGQWLTPEALDAALGGARFVVLGETHDNADHHRLQAERVRALTASGRQPALAFEMLDAGQQPLLDETRQRSPGDPDALARAVDWEHSGWPEWALYRPLFAVGLERGLPLVGANLPRPEVRRLVKVGPGALAPETRARLGLDAPVPEAQEKQTREEMSESHCGQLPESLLGPMAFAQRARDAQMADRLLGTATAAGGLLIAGAGHARTDRGVPAYVLRREPGLRVASLAFVEVDPEAREPHDYPLPYDYVWFTPAAEREDPCAPLRAAPEKAPGK
ncbi:MAG TPA: ChaN family lipoprotein [Cystobacter sp.]